VSLPCRSESVPRVSFGGGIHHCVGARLARIEAEIAIATLIRRLPKMQLDDIERSWRQAFVLRRLNKLPASCRADEGVKTDGPVPHQTDAIRALPPYTVVGPAENGHR
jgi:hypothetical protein